MIVLGYCSTLHLGHPERVGEHLANGKAWLSREGLVSVITFSNGFILLFLDQ